MISTALKSLCLRTMPSWESASEIGFSCASHCASLASASAPATADYLAWPACPFAYTFSRLLAFCHVPLAAEQESPTFLAWVAIIQITACHQCLHSLAVLPSALSAPCTHCIGQRRASALQSDWKVGRELSAKFSSSVPSTDFLNLAAK